MMKRQFYFMLVIVSILAAYTLWYYWHNKRAEEPGES